MCWWRAAPRCSGALAHALADPVAASLDPSGSPWTGYGGVGDYRWANGNTEAVMNAAHGIRDGLYAQSPEPGIDETVDLVIVGGGFSGITAAFEFNKRRKPGQTCLLLENHAMFGGEARQNEFVVDGRRLAAPQGSNAGLVVKPTDQISGRYETYAEYYRELEHALVLRVRARWPAGRRSTTSTNDHFEPMILEKEFATGYFFPGVGWARNPIAADFANTPWPANVQRELADFVGNRRDLVSAQADPDRWLDSMSYYDLLDRLGYGDRGQALRRSAARRRQFRRLRQRHLRVRREAPDAAGDHCQQRVEPICGRGGNFLPGRQRRDRAQDGCAHDSGFDRGRRIVEVDHRRAPWTSRSWIASGAPVRIRLESTAVKVRHDGDPASAGSVLVTYARNGKLHTVRAKAVVLGSGGWVNRRIVADLPPSHAEAYAQFRYGPVLTANVAVRHWRYIDALGISVARWFSGLGWHVCVRRNATFEKDAPPLTPDSPIVLTFYIPFLNPGVDPSVQGSAGRAQLLSPSYADFERQLREQMTEMFGAAGFDARRDIAGIVLNRWGHAYFAPPVGFFFGKDGQPAPHDVIRRPHGRIVFAHSELQGNMNMAHAMLEGKRGAHQALELI